MARKLKSVDAKPEVEEVSRTNFTGYDGSALIEDVNRINEMVDNAKEGAQPVKDERAKLKAERGYHMKAFADICGMARKDTLEQRDWWRTIKAWAEAQGLDDPDLVDRMEAA